MDTIVKKTPMLVVIILTVGLVNNAWSTEPAKPMPTSDAVLINEEKSVKLVERVEPKYPSKMLKMGIEGKVRLEYCIEKDGSVSNVQAGKSTHHTFSREAKKALLQWTYTPLQAKGEPVKRCELQITLSFDTPKGKISRRLSIQHRKIREALVNKEYQQAKQRLLKLSAMNGFTRSEQVYFHVLSAEYAKAMGDQNSQLHHLFSVVLRSSPLMPVAQKLALLSQHFVLAVKLQNFGQAKVSYKGLAKMAEAEPYMARFDAIMAKVNAYIAGDHNIVINAKIRDRLFWKYPLARSEFSITQVKGELQQLKIRCGKNYQAYTIEKSHTWQLPAEWQNCYIYVYGDENASFELIEHPLKS